MPEESQPIIMMSSLISSTVLFAFSSLTHFLIFYRYDEAKAKYISVMEWIIARYISTETCNRGKKYRYPVRYKKNGNDDYKGYKEIATQKDFDLF